MAKRFGVPLVSVRAATSDYGDPAIDIASMDDLARLAEMSRRSRVEDLSPILPAGFDPGPADGCIWREHGACGQCFQEGQRPRDKLSWEPAAGESSDSFRDVVHSPGRHSDPHLCASVPFLERAG